MREIHVVVLGASGVGKSKAILQYLNERLLSDGELPEMADSYRKQFVYQDQVFLLDIIDTEGSDQYDAMRDGLYYTGQAFLMIYSITSKKSFLKLEYLRRQLLRVKQVSHVPMVLVGNFCDCEEQRQVSQEEANTVAELWHCPFLEISARTSSATLDIIMEKLFFQIYPPSVEREELGSKTSRIRCIMM